MVIAPPEHSVGVRINRSIRKSRVEKRVVKDRRWPLYETGDDAILIKVKLVFVRTLPKTPKQISRR